MIWQIDRTVLHSPVARKGQMTIPEKGRKGLRVKLGDKLTNRIWVNRWSKLWGYAIQEIRSRGLLAEVSKD
jgi:hypothetical protein